MNDLISRQAALDDINKLTRWSLLDRKGRHVGVGLMNSDVIRTLFELPPVQGKYEYHYDHTDCIWYRPEARNRCPSTCAQYRDGWNDAMNYIFRDGEGYRPYRRDKPYEK